MKPVVVPTTDVNSETARLIAWHCSDGSEVRRGDPLATIETSKAVLDLAAEDSGFVLQLVAQDRDFPITDSIGLIAPTASELTEERERRAQAATAAASRDSAARITRKAAELAERHGIDPASIDADGLITVKHVEAAMLRQSAEAAGPAAQPLATEPGIERILLIGGGKAATQILNILRRETSQSRAVVAIVDDTPSKQGTLIEDVPVIGPTGRLGELAADSTVDSAIVAISTSVVARTRFREACAAAGLPLADNIVDPSAVISPDVVMGHGNVICALCHFGNGTTVGDNNFISAFNSFDHHNVIGSDCSTGPGCKTSGSVTVGDRVRLGTGIFIEPMVTLGSDVQVASGAIILSSIPAGHAVKTKVVTTTVVPPGGQKDI